MFNFEKLQKRYQEDPAFNKVVNLNRSLIEKFGFLPSEIREAFFLAQFMYEMNHVEQVIRTQQDWEQIEAARKILQTAVLDVKALQEFEP